MAKIDKLWTDKRKMRCLALTDATSWRTSPFRDDLQGWSAGDQVSARKKNKNYFLHNHRLRVTISASKIGE